MANDRTTSLSTASAFSESGDSIHARPLAASRAVSNSSSLSLRHWSASASSSATGSSILSSCLDTAGDRDMRESFSASRQAITRVWDSATGNRYELPSSFMPNTDTPYRSQHATNDPVGWLMLMILARLASRARSPMAYQSTLVRRL